MHIHTLGRLLAGAAILALTFGSAAVADASKEQFERDKPHLAMPAEKAAEADAVQAADGHEHGKKGGCCQMHEKMHGGEGGCCQMHGKMHGGEGGCCRMHGKMHNGEGGCCQMHMNKEGKETGCKMMAEGNNEMACPMMQKQKPLEMKKQKGGHDHAAAEPAAES